MAQRYNRTNILRMLLKTRQLSSLKDIQTALLREGCKASLATISNDLDQLRVARVKTAGGQYYALPDHPLYQRIIAEEATPPVLRSVGFKRLVMSGNLAVIHTELGHAQALAATIDAARLNAVAGTIAGIDTLVVVVAEGVPREEFLEALASIIPAINSSF